MEKSKILIVDDKEENLLALKQTLLEEGPSIPMEILTASSGLEALKFTLYDDFALIILDVQMPKMNGFELAELLRGKKKTQEIPIMFLSAVYSSEYSVMKGFILGAVDFLTKPVDTRILMNKIKTFVQLDQHKKDLKVMTEQAESANKAKSRFLSSMSHEIRTPMSAILGMTHLCLQTDLTAKQNDYLTKVHRSATSLLRIINDILDFSKIESGKMEMEAVDFDLDDIFEHISNSISTEAQGGELEFLIHSSADLPRFLIGDPLRLEQILLNLASNAVKFTKQGEVVIYTELCRQEKDRVTLQFAVRDTGIGLDAAQIAELFQSFSQADSSTTRKFGGTGLGLTIVKQLVELMEGEIWVESEPGKGSSFIFTAVFGLQTTEKQKIPALSIDLKGMRVLVVDDNANAREIFENMLGSLSFQVTSCTSGAEALLEIEKADPPFELVLMDWKMPGLDGIETSGRIRELTELSLPPKIIMVTAYGVEEAPHQAGDIHLDGFLLKPVTPTILINSIMAAFGKKAAQNPRYATIQKTDPELLKPIRGARILLVEDNEINQQIAQEVLEQAGFVVQIAENGKIAVEQVKKHQYEAVLMDIQMPVMDGYETSLEIRKNPDFKDLPIIAMTADAMVTDKAKAFEVGMNDHIAKPIDLKQLFSSLLKWIPPGEYETDQVKPGPDPAAVTEKVVLELAGINTTSGLARMGGNQEFYHKLLVKFQRDNQQLTAQISQALHTENAELAHRLVHTVKGIAGNLGALDLQAAAVKLEAVMKQGKLTETLKLLEAFDSELKIVIDGLKQLAETDESTPPPPETEKEAGSVPFLLEQLKKLDLCLQNLEPKPSKTLIEEIARYYWPETFSSPIEQLAILVSKYKLTDAQQVLIKLTDTVRRIEKF
ncbi:MAG: response regulator [SAR324 cluster bacterium]|nr:response regulator [SAR324 cluster bacterium]